MKTFFLVLFVLAVLFAIALVGAFLVVGVYLYCHRDDLDFADFAPEWDYYRQSLARELRKTEEAFLVAFVNKFDLFDITPKESDDNKDDDKMSEKDLERIRRALGLISSIEANPYRKLLGQ